MSLAGFEKKSIKAFTKGLVPTSNVTFLVWLRKALSMSEKQRGKKGSYDFDNQCS